MFWQGNAKLSTHMKVHSQSNGSHMPESSDALFLSHGAKRIWRPPPSGAWVRRVGEQHARQLRATALRSCGYSCYGVCVKPTSPAGPRPKSRSSRSKHGSAHNCSWHPGQSREWWVGTIFTLSLTLEHCVASRDSNPIKKISAHEGKTQSSKT